MSPSAVRPPRGRIGLVSLLVAAALLGSALAPLGSAPVLGDSLPDHLVISEVVTGGSSASDELIELYNPASDPLPLEGLEVVYVTASGLTVTRRAAWDAGAPELAPGRHLLVANELGTYAGIADALYASGMAASGGSVAIRIQGASTAIDAVGWGTATSTWLEGTPASAPAAGASLERLPGGALGSTRDTDDNAADFVQRLAPDPQNLASPAVPDPSAPSPAPTPAPSPSEAPTPSATPTADPTPDDRVAVATARALPDGTAVTIEGTALSGSTFTEGGGYVADASAGIAVLLGSGSFERGTRLRISGTIDDRFAQRTLRAAAADVTVLGTGTDPEPLERSTGSIGEPVEGALVRIAGTAIGSPTTLSSGLAYELDDGSGPVRVLVGSTTGIDTAAWTSGADVEVVGVVGQRDSTGTGVSGYRVQPRDAADVGSVTAPTPSPTGSASPDPSASPPAHGVATVAEARALPKNARTRVRGTITMPPGVVDPVSAVIQDGTGAILLRVADEVGPLARGERIEVHGTRSTLRGMETLRVTAPALRLGSGAEPSPASVRTGEAGETLEARLVQVRGELVAAARRVASGTVSFEIDDGSGPLRVYLAAALGAETDGLVAGAWVEATGVLGQDTTGAQPLRGYRVWPRTAGEVRVSASPTAPGAAGAGPTAGGSSPDPGSAGPRSGPEPSLADVGDRGLAGLRIGATIVHGPWSELRIGGLLWDGDRLVAVHEASAGGVRRLLGDRRPPLPVELTSLVAGGTDRRTGLPVVRLGEGSGDVGLRDGVPHAPRVAMPEVGAAWVSLVGRLAGHGANLRLEVSDASFALTLHCDADVDAPRGRVQVTGVGLAEPARLVVPCGGVRAAPALAGATDRAMAATVGGVEQPQPTAARDPDRPEPMRGVAAGLLAIGSLVVALAGVLARRLDPDPSAEPRPPDDAVPESDSTPGAGPPALTLVSVPHERGSP